MFELNNNTILLISQQSWGVMHVSKHHYAIELAKRGNTVYFLNPPDENLTHKILINQVKEHSGLYTVSYKPLFNFSLRFKLRIGYDLLIRLQINSILKALPQKPDITWCFEPNLFSDLQWFKTKINFYHPVDPLFKKYQYYPAKTATAVFSVSEQILSGLRKYNQNCYFINHGISSEFEEFARKNLESLPIPAHHPINVGYVGNLLRGIIDHELIIRIVTDHPEVKFHFWGPSKLDESNLSGGSGKSISDFIYFLEKRPNVTLHGPKKSKVLISEISEMDAFLLVYKEKVGESDRSNAHKILEYLSTGKVVIANLISTYKAYENLLIMPPDADDSKIPALFNECVTKITYYNSNDLQEQRLMLAINNTYKSQIYRIEKTLSKIIN